MPGLLPSSPRLHTPRQTSRPHVKLLGLPQFKCSAENFLHDLTSYSSCGVLVFTIFVNSVLSLTLFLAAIFSQCKIVQPHTGIWGRNPLLQLTQVQYEFHPQLCHKSHSVESVCQHMFSQSHTLFISVSAFFILESTGG